MDKVKSSGVSHSKIHDTMLGRYRGNVSEQYSYALVTVYFDCISSLTVCTGRPIIYFNPKRDYALFDCLNYLVPNHNNQSNPFTSIALRSVALKCCA